MTMMLRKILVVLTALTFTPFCFGHIGIFNFYAKNKTTVTNKSTIKPILNLKTISLVPRTVPNVAKEIFRTTLPTFSSTTTEINELEKSENAAEPVSEKFPHLGTSDHNQVASDSEPHKINQEIDETNKDNTITNYPGRPTTRKPSTEKPSSEKPSSNDKTIIACTCTAIGGSSTTVVTSITSTKDTGLETFERKTVEHILSTPSGIGSDFPPSVSSPLKRKITVTITKTEPFTVYRTPPMSTCLEIEDVNSICDGKLITISPTSVVESEVTKYKRESKQGKMNYEVLERPNDYDPEPILIRPTLTTPQMTQSSLPHLHEDEYPSSNVVESSKPDLDFEEVKIVDEHWLKLTSPKINFVTKFIRETVTKPLPNPGVTATVIAKKCLPLDLDLPFCNVASAFTSIKSILNRKDNLDEGFRILEVPPEIVTRPSFVEISSFPFHRRNMKENEG